MYIVLEKENVDKNTLFTLDLEDLRGYGYPIPPFLDESVTLPEGWKETRPAFEPTDKKKLIAIDCEMVLTEKGRALARVSLVDEGIVLNIRNINIINKYVYED